MSVNMSSDAPFVFPFLRQLNRNVFNRSESGSNDKRIKQKEKKNTVFE